MYSDAHIHLKDLSDKTGNTVDIPENCMVCASAWNAADFLAHEEVAVNNPGRVFQSFGVHPQNPDRNMISFLETLVEQKRIVAVGECGLDYYTADYRSRRDDQMFIWDAQRSIARNAGLPLVLHGRKAMAAFFSVSRELARLPAVIFHGWGGSPVEARSFLDRGVNAFFSVGKALLRGHRNLRETVRLIGPEHLLSETDAPWMTLKGEAYSRLEDIIPVVRAMAETCGMPEENLEAWLRDNFLRVFSGPF